MKLNIIDYNNWVKKLKEVTNPKFVENNKFTRNGIFSQQIFGPVKSYYCACNKSTYRGRKSKLSKCPDCGVSITSSYVRRKRYARINLPFKILNPLIYFIVTNNKYSTKRILDKILSYKEIYYIEDEIIKSVEEDKDKIGKNFLIGGEGALEYIKLLYKDKTDPVSEFINKNINQVLIEDIIVIPPAYRPYTKTGGSDSNFILDEINKYYIDILNKSNLTKRLILNESAKNEYYIFNFKSTQKSAIELYQFVLDKLSKKKGLIRSNILGKRVDFSGRAVITPDPDLSLDECGIPYCMILEILKPQLSSYLIETRIKKRYNSAVELIDNCINTESFELFNTVKKFCKDKVCILNRQPTLHRLSILGFKIIPHTGKTIKIHPLVCNAYNADFDGDTMAFYPPITENSKVDIENKINIKNNLISPTDGNIVAIPNQDIILGIYELTKNDDEKLIEYKGKKITEGRKKFNECFPEDYPVINRTIKKSDLYVILNRIALLYKNNPEVIINILDNIKKLGFEYSSKIGVTLNIPSMYSEKLEEYSKELTGNIKTDFPKMKSKKVTDELKKLPFANLIDSGARGTWEQASQLVYCRGYVANFDNKIRKDIIKSNLINGLTPDDFFNSSYGARKGLLDTAMSTGESGYITRQLIYSTNFMEIADDDYIKKEISQIEQTENKENYDNKKIEIISNLADCKVEEYLHFKISDDPNIAKKQIKSVVGRYYLNDEGSLSKVPELITLKDEDFHKSLYGKTLKLRSPLYCKNKKICRICYGDNYNILHSSQIGLIAAQALGERLTQLILRTFHTSGVVDSIEKRSKDKSESNKDIISGMTYVNKLLHKPSKLSEDDSKEKITEKDIVLKLYELFSLYGDIYLVHFEVVVSAMLWTKGGNYWRTVKDRDTVEKRIESILKIPSLSSWLIGLAFSNVKSKLIEGVIYNKKDVETSISSLFRF